MNSEKTVIEAAMKLPPKSRANVAERLMLSLIGKDVLVAGAKLAEARWQAYSRGETGAKPAREALQAVVQRKRKRP